MRWLSIAAAAIVIAIPLSGCGGGGTSAETSIRNLLDQEIALAKKSDFRGAYALVSPNARKMCPYETWVKQFDRVDLSQYSVSDVHVTISGDHATANYTVHAGDRTAARTDDQFVKVDGRWYDELDPGDTCT